MTTLTNILRLEQQASWRWSIKIWLFARIILSAWAAVIWKLGLINYNAGKEFYLGVTPIVNGLMGSLLGVWQRWDTIYYIRIAQYGYNSEDLTAYFPLYPVLGRFFSLFLGGNVLLGLFIVSNLAFLLSLMVLYSLTAYEHSPQLGHRALLTLIFSPMSFFFLAAYPQSLALLLVLLSYWSAKRENWGWATLAGLAAGLTHSTVLPLVLALAWEAWQFWREAPKSQRLTAFAAPLAPLLGMGAFFTWRTLAGFAPYQVVAGQIWGRSVQWPWQTIMDIGQLIRTGQLPGTVWINLGIICFVSITAVATLRVINCTQRIYLISFLVYLFLVTTIKEPYASFGRYSLLLFPLYIGIAYWQTTHFRRLFFAVLGISLQLFFSGVFIMWGWVN